MIQESENSACYFFIFSISLICIISIGLTKSIFNDFAISYCMFSIKTSLYTNVFTLRKFFDMVDICIANC